jgi:hypothetical protein
MMRLALPKSHCKYAHPLGATAIVAAVLCAVGCGGPERVELHPTQGQVVQGGKPAAGAQVTLHPAASIADGPEKTLRPTGIADGSGNYALSTYVSGDGAPAGEWIVTVVWPDPKFPPERRQELEAEGNTVPDALGGRYARPEGSPWKVTIAPGENALPTIDLSKP